LEGNQLFPVFIKLDTLHTLVVGGGPVGLEKLSALLNNSPSAKITLVALEILPQLKELAAKFPNVSLSRRAFELGDLDTAELVIAATNNADLNDQIRAAAKERKILANFADKPELCDFSRLISL
jgi:siroheme synthase-like protein